MVSLDALFSGDAGAALASGPKYGEPEVNVPVAQ
jgi:hypothetical protein